MSKLKKVTIRFDEADIEDIDSLWPNFPRTEIVRLAVKKAIAVRRKEITEKLKEKNGE